LIDNGKYYCSELIYEAFKPYKTFRLKPMNYISEEFPEITKFWQFYFNKLLKTDVPQGKPGITPGDISLSKKVNIIFIPNRQDGEK